MKFIRKNKSKFTFFNGKYYFSLGMDWIRKGYGGEKFAVNIEDIDLDHDPELKEKYPYKRISKKQINQQIDIIRKSYPEILL